jgi:hypothetical protein
MKSSTWLGAFALAGALAHPVGAGALDTPRTNSGRAECFEVVLRVPLGHDRAVRCEVLVLDPSALTLRVTRVTRVLVRVAIVVLEHLAGDDLRAPRSR